MAFDFLFALFRIASSPSAGKEIACMFSSCAVFIFEPLHDKTNEMICSSSEYSDQPGHSPSLIRVFAVRMKIAASWVFSYPLSAQADLSLCWAHGHFVGFVMRRLILCRPWSLFGVFSRMWNLIV